MTTPTTEPTPTQDTTTPQTEVKKEHRTRQEIKADYKEAAAVLGDKTYRMKLLEVETEELCKKMYFLNQEHMDSENNKTPQPTMVNMPPQGTQKGETA